MRACVRVCACAQRVCMHMCVRDCVCADVRACVIKVHACVGACVCVAPARALRCLLCLIQLHGDIEEFHVK